MFEETLDEILHLGDHGDENYQESHESREYFKQMMIEGAIKKGGLGLLHQMIPRAMALDVK